ncbi:hypothetical protein KEJ48_03250 [Candidatus Bathyarchaeota archaeon]|nr:hypothetical protein [Candidatus Bathyarchaeota archaeon]
MALNRGKIGRPFKITYRHIGFLTVVHYLSSMPYRQLKGFSRDLNRLIPRLHLPEKPSKAEFQGKILEFLWWMKKQGYANSTIED